MNNGTGISIRTGNVGRDISGVIAGGNVNQSQHITPEQRQEVTDHAKSIKSEIEKGEKQGDVKTILAHLTGIAKISTKLIAPFLFGDAGKIVASLITDEADQADQ